MTPVISTTTSSSTPSRYSHGEMRRRKLGLACVSASMAAVPSASRMSVRSTVSTLWPEAL